MLFRSSDWTVAVRWSFTANYKFGVSDSLAIKYLIRGIGPCSSTHARRISCFVHSIRGLPSKTGLQSHGTNLSYYYLYVAA